MTEIAPDLLDRVWSVYAKVRRQGAIGVFHHNVIVIGTYHIKPSNDECIRQLNERGWEVQVLMERQPVRAP